MTEQITRFYDPVDKTLEKLYKENLLRKPRDEIPFVNSTFFLAPNGDYLWMGDAHTTTIQNFASEQSRLPNGSIRPLEQGQNMSFYTDLNIIKVTYEPKPNNRLDYIFFTPPTPAQLRTIYKTYKDIPDLWITYDVVDMDKPFSYSGEGYRNMLADLRKADYLPKE